MLCANKACSLFSMSCSEPHKKKLIDRVWSCVQSAFCGDSDIVHCIFERFFAGLCPTKKVFLSGSLKIGH